MAEEYSEDLTKMKYKHNTLYTLGKQSIGTIHNTVYLWVYTVQALLVCT